MDLGNLKELQAVKYDDIKHDKLIDVSEVDIDINIDIVDRLEKFINDIKNPYIMKCGNTIVEIEFSDTDKTINCQLKSYIKSLKTGDFSC